MTAAEKTGLPAWGAIVLTIIAGGAMPVQARVNGALSQAIGDSILAALISFGGGAAVLIAGAVLIAPLRRTTGVLVERMRSGAFPWWYMFAGVLGATLVFSQALTVPVIGVALITVALIAGQTTSGLMVDAIGFAATTRNPPTRNRIIGVVLTIVAVAWSVSSHMGARLGIGTTVVMVVIVLAAGFGNGFQQAMNGSITRATANPSGATLLNFVTGTVALAMGWAIKVGVGGLPATFDTQWWMYLGGPIGIVFIAISALTVPRIGVLLVSLCMVAGQLLSSLLVDLIAPTAETTIGVGTIGGLVLTLVAVFIASGFHRRLRRTTRDDSSLS